MSEKIGSTGPNFVSSSFLASAISIQSVVVSHSMRSRELLLIPPFSHRMNLTYSQDFRQKVKIVSNYKTLNSKSGRTFYALLKLANLLSRTSFKALCVTLQKDIDHTRAALLV